MKSAKMDSQSAQLASKDSSSTSTTNAKRSIKTANFMSTVSVKLAKLDTSSTSTSVSPILSDVLNITEKLVPNVRKDTLSSMKNATALKL
jgi:hypothetical protein